MNPRIFAGIYPAGIVYADRGREVNRDYKRLAFLPFATLELRLEPDCRPDFAAEIKVDAAAIQARRGQPFQVSTSGQTVILGKS